MKASQKILEILNLDLGLDYTETEGANFHSAIQVKLRIFFSVLGKIRNFKGNHIEASQFTCAENELII